MPTTIATTTKPPPYTPPAGDAARDPLRERDLQLLCNHDVEVRTAGLDLATITIRLSDLDHILTEVRFVEAEYSAAERVTELESQLDRSRDTVADLRQDLAEAASVHEAELRDRDERIEQLRRALQEAGR